MEINNFDKLKSIKPSYIRIYLEKNGWVKVPLKHKKLYEIFQLKKDDALFQVNVPTTNEIADYEDMILSACSKLSSLENLTIEEIALRMSNPQADIVKIRQSSSSVSNGTIPFNEALSLMENSKKLIADAAMDITAKTKYRTSRYTKEVDLFLSRCRFGQTEFGSYVISVVCPFDNVNQNNQEQLRLFDDGTKPEENFARKVVNKLFDSVKQISKSFKNNQDLSTFIDKEDDSFISLNFMEDLNNLSVNEDGAFVELMAEYDPISKNKEEIVTNIVFSSKERNKLSSFVDMKKKEMAKEEEQLISIYGYISKTNAEPILQQRVNGEITLKDENSSSSYKVVLDNDDYGKAIYAHKEGKLVKVTGKKNGERIINPVFEVIKEK